MWNYNKIIKSLISNGYYEFKNYLLQNGMDLEKVKKKITIEIAWNDFIMNNFKNQGNSIVIQSVNENVIPHFLKLILKRPSQDGLFFM